MRAFPILFLIFLQLLYAASELRADESPLVFDKGEGNSSFNDTGNSMILFPTPALRQAPFSSARISATNDEQIPYHKDLTRAHSGNNTAHRVGRAMTRKFWRTLIPGLPSRVLPK